jgi:hypothetical protein
MANVDRTRALTSVVEEGAMRHLKLLAGDLLPEMLASEAGAMRFLEHNSPKVRSAAIKVLCDHWKLRGTGWFADICEVLSVRDPDLLVRCGAISALGRCFRCTDDVRVGACLARFVRDETESNQVRLSAYLALLSVRRPNAILQLHPVQLTSVKNVDDVVDWALVSESLNISRSPVPIDPLWVGVPRPSEKRLAEFQLYTQGMEAFNRGEYEESARYFSDLLRDEPHAVGVRVARARAYIELGRLEDAIAELSRALELCTTSSDASNALRERGRAYRLKGEVNLAEQDERAAAGFDARE